MKLEIEKDAIASVHEGPDDVGSSDGEQLAADLEAADGAAEPIGKRQGFPRSRDVEGD